MKHSLPKTGRLARYGAATAAAAAIALIGGPAVLAQDPGTTPEPPTISMEVQGKRLFFDGPATVAKGEELRIVNNTSVRKVGPHTFSLAKKNVLPDTPNEFKQCFTPGHICMDIATAHKFNPKTEKIAKPVVDAGAKGWSRGFAKNRTGDSWYTETKGETHTRRVTASAGSTLRFLCAVHPDMQGKIKVVAAE